MKKSPVHRDVSLPRAHLKLLLCHACAITCACAALESPSTALPKDMTDQELVNTLNSGDARQRAEACKRLGDGKNTLAIPQIGQVAEKDPSLDTREACIQALAKMGTPDSAEILRRIASSDPNESMRLEALDALQKVDTEEQSSPVVIQILLNDRSVRVRKEAAGIIGEQRWKSGIPALAEVAKSNAPLELRTECLEQLLRMGDPAANAVIYEILEQSTSVDMRRKAAELLADHPPASAFEPLCQALNDQDEGVASDAVKGLLKLGDKSAAPILRNAAQRHTGKLADKMNEAADKLSK